MEDLYSICIFLEEKAVLLPEFIALHEGKVHRKRCFISFTAHGINTKYIKKPKSE